VSELVKPLTKEQRKAAKLLALENGTSDQDNQSEVLQ